MSTYHIRCQSKRTNTELKISNLWALVLVEHAGGNHGEEQHKKATSYTFNPCETGIGGAREYRCPKMSIAGILFNFSRKEVIETKALC